MQAALTLGIALSLAFPTVVDAGERVRARLSKTLADRLEARLDEPVQIIIDGDRTHIERLAKRYNLEIERRLRRGAVLVVTGGQLDALARDPEVSHLSADSVVRPTMAVTHRAIGADQAWEGTLGLDGVTGAGIGIAIIDSGIADHADLQQRVVAGVDFVGDGATRRVKARRRSEGSDTNTKKFLAPPHSNDADQANNADDQFGHGTHVAGIAAARPSKDSIDAYAGVAPGAHLLSLRVLDDQGIGRVSGVIDAIDWAIENKDRYAIRILNLSLGAPVDESYVDDPLAQAAERAVAAGLIVVCSAGNNGTTDDGTSIVGGVESPGHAPSVITVGALKTQGTPERSDDTVATYSSRGPTPFDGFIKPDLVAAGNKVVSAEAPRSYLAETYPELHVSGTRQTRLLRDERHQHVGRRHLGLGCAAAARQPDADTGAGEDGAPAVGLADTGRRAGRGWRRQPERPARAAHGGARPRPGAAGRDDRRRGSVAPRGRLWKPDCVG